MMEVSKKDGGFLFNDDFFFVIDDDWKDQENKILIMSTRWPDMNYQISIKDRIEYPWVYNFDDMHIICEGEDELLNFIIKTEKDSFAVVQDVNSIDADNYEDVKEVFINDEIQFNKFLKLDIDTKVTNLETI